MHLLLAKAKLSRHGSDTSGISRCRFTEEQKSICGPCKSPILEQVDAEETVIWWSGHAGARSWHDQWACGEKSMLEQFLKN
ncbi:hypothetical protein WISP_16801 [Willisornis vidua]|uniref:Uncharacterized protein n=1 Tax=Willisornis vidua TaxID=1566151 RepID=A0ABQ9DPN3_9PASS|nr:hypothetical protein WISP_16801 [Willisornis vidua]